MTLTVLEHYIPRFFKGSTDEYYGKSLLILGNLGYDDITPISP